jgi:hypothetical protein
LTAFEIPEESELFSIKGRYRVAKLQQYYW